MADREQILMRAMGDAIRERIAKTTPTYRLALPSAQVINEVKVPPSKPADVVMQVDMQPVADAINRFTEIVGELVDALLAQKASEIKAEFKPEIHVPEIKMPESEGPFIAEAVREFTQIASHLLEQLAKRRRRRIVKDGQGEPVGIEDEE